MLATTKGFSDEPFPIVANHCIADLARHGNPQARMGQTIGRCMDHKNRVGDDTGRFESPIEVFLFIDSNGLWKFFGVSISHAR